MLSVRRALIQTRAHDEAPSKHIIHISNGINAGTAWRVCIDACGTTSGAVKKSIPKARVD